MGPRPNEGAQTGFPPGRDPPRLQDLEETCVHAHPGGIVQTVLLTSVSGQSLYGRLPPGDGDPPREEEERQGAFDSAPRAECRSLPPRVQARELIQVHRDGGARQSYADEGHGQGKVLLLFRGRDRGGRVRLVGFLRRVVIDDRRQEQRHVPLEPSALVQRDGAWGG